MPTLLHIDSSPRSNSVSSELTKEFAAAWKAKHPGGTHIHRNTAESALPFVDEALIGAYYTPEDKRTDEQKTHLALSDKLVNELISADTIVLGLPMWNFGVPASFKAWIDLVARVGKTFRYGANGPEGLLKPETKVVVIAARGGFYSEGSPMASFDQQEPGIRTLFGFLGLRDIHFVYVENQGRPDKAPEAKAQAAAKIANHFA